MMSVERSFEAWEEVQRHGQDLADRLAQGFTGLIQSHITPPLFPWPNSQKPKLFEVEFPSQNFVVRDFGLAVDNSNINGVSAIFDIGNRIGQAGVDFGACINGMVQQFFRRIPVPFRHEETMGISLRTEVNNQRNDIGITLQEDLGSLAERFRDYGFTENEKVSDGPVDKETSGFNLNATKLFGRSQGAINFTSTYESRTRNIESSLVARGDFWRVEASQGSSTSGNETSSLFLVQLGPVLFVRDSTLLLPIHLSKQHLLWYGYDRKLAAYEMEFERKALLSLLSSYWHLSLYEPSHLGTTKAEVMFREMLVKESIHPVKLLSSNGVHSLCPAMWSKHRRWLLMSMICLNPVACSFMDLQFPNGQITYVAGEGISTSAFLPCCGGLLQAQGQYPGEMRFSFSCKNKWGTCLTPMVQWPDKSFTLGMSQSLAWRRSGLMVRPTIQFSLCPTFGGSNPGVRAELTHTVKEELSLVCGCEIVSRPSAFASIALGRSKWNGNIGNSGVVVKVETPLDNVGRPAFSVQLNSGIEF